jgi:hypothetical protein
VPPAVQLQAPGPFGATNTGVARSFLTI